VDSAEPGFYNPADFANRLVNFGPKIRFRSGPDFVTPPIFLTLLGAVHMPNGNVHTAESLKPTGV
jgi:hypothetical protein